MLLCMPLTNKVSSFFQKKKKKCYCIVLYCSPAARGGNLAKIPPNQVIDDFGRGSSVESESE